MLNIALRLGVELALIFFPIAFFSYVKLNETQPHCAYFFIFSFFFRFEVSLHAIIQKNTIN